MLSDDGFHVFIGRNARQNEKVTWQLAHAEDIWLHTQHVPGSHVIIRSNGQDVPLETLVQAASWAAYHSKARSDTKTSVLYTRRRDLRRIKGGRPGQVRVLRHRSLTVNPKQPPQA